MHNLAIALRLKGFIVSGSDDEIYEPSRSRLKDHGLYRKKQGGTHLKWILKRMRSLLGCMQ